MNQSELLIPAGDLERLKIAIRFGADAVYCGGKKLSLRNRAGNLTLEQIQEGVEFAKEHQAKIYVTVNMMPREEDLQEVIEYLNELKRVGVAGIIVSSLYLIKLAHQFVPDLPLHLSTQQNTLNSESIKYWKNLGVQRIVLGRELSLSEIERIKHVSALELEVFIHGGMCSNYSGRCLLSNVLTDRDANRGGCAQCCRWNYYLSDGEKQLNDETSFFTMSSKDLETLKYLDCLLALGISSLKIEGRMKSGYYVACVTKAYRYLIDKYYESGKITSTDLNEARKIMGPVQNRETFPGFLIASKPEEMILRPKLRDTVAQDYIGEVTGYDSKTKLATIRMRNHFEIGEELEMVTPHEQLFSFPVNKMLDENNLSLTVANLPMQQLKIEVPKPVNTGDYTRRRS